MVKKTILTYASSDGVRTIKACKWVDEAIKPRGIFQIIHGMQEYVERYDELARFLCSKGFVVVGNDHLGHGGSAAEGEKGYFTEVHGERVVIKDIHHLRKIMTKKYPELPYFILGHSMGSFFARKYIAVYGKGLKGAIICGTGTKPRLVTLSGLIMANIIGFPKKGHNTSKFIEKQSFGKYNSRIDDIVYGNEWVVRNEDILRAYNEDPDCGFPFTTNGYRTLFTVLLFASNKKNLTTIPKELPIYVIAGEEDPVGDYGKGPGKVYETYKKLGIEDVSISLYKDMRHEILNDVDRKKVFDDILDWLENRI